MDEFIFEMKQMSFEDLENAINTLQDAYTNEEFQIIKNEYAIRMEEKAIDKPVIIYCKKCDGANELGNKKCKYCNMSLDKYNLKVENDIKSDDNGIMGYVIAFIIPLIGFIMGLIFIARKEDKYGMKLIVTSIISSIIYLIILSLMFS